MGSHTDDYSMNWHPVTGDDIQTDCFLLASSAFIDEIEAARKLATTETVTGSSDVEGYFNHVVTKAASSAVSSG